MKLSCSTIPFQNMPLGSSFRRMKELGFGIADLPIYTYKEWCHVTPEGVRQDPAMALALIDTAVTTSGIEIGMILTATNADSNQAVRLGVKMITVNSWFKDEWVERNRLKDFLIITRERGQVLCLETHPLGPAVDPEVAHHLVSETPGLRLTLDAANMLSHGFAPVTWIPLFPYVSHVHIKDAGHTPDRRQVPWGTGELDAAFIINGLKRVKYDGIISIDYTGPRSDDSIKFDPIPEILKAKADLEKLIA